MSNAHAHRSRASALSTGSCLANWTTELHRELVNHRLTSPIYTGIVRWSRSKRTVCVVVRSSVSCRERAGSELNLKTTENSPRQPAWQSFPKRSVGEAREEAVRIPRRLHLVAPTASHLLSGKHWLPKVELSQSAASFLSPFASCILVPSLPPMGLFCLLEEL